VSISSGSAICSGVSSGGAGKGGGGGRGRREVSTKKTMVVITVTTVGRSLFFKNPEKPERRRGIGAMNVHRLLGRK
jgi:hypothetical protein